MTNTQINIIPTIILFSFIALIAYSILVMFGGKNIFRKASKKETVAYYPIINLFNMLEITELSIFFGILFFVPVINIIVLIFIFYKLGTVFNTNIYYKLGLVFFPIIFYPLLSHSNKQYKVKEQESFKDTESVKINDVNLMTQEELDKLNDNEEDNTPKVDSIFKGKIEQLEEVAPYKAVKIDLFGIEKLKDSNINDKIDDKTKKTSINEKKKNDVEIIDL